MASSSSHNKLEQRSYIKIRALLGNTTNSIYKDLVQAYSMKGALSYPAVRRWAQRFRVSRDSAKTTPDMGHQLQLPLQLTSLPLRN